MKYEATDNFPDSVTDDVTDLYTVGTSNSKAQTSLLLDLCFGGSSSKASALQARSRGQSKPESPWSTHSRLLCSGYTPLPLG